MRVLGFRLGAGDLRIARIAYISLAACSSASDAFLRDCKVRLRPNTYRSYAGVLRRFCEAHGRLRMSAVGAAEISAYVLSQREVGRTDSGINVDLRALKAFLRWAAEEGFISRAPRVRLLKVSRKLAGEALAAADVRSLLGAGDCARDRALVGLVAAVGLRIDEALWLRWEDVDLGKGCVLVRPKQGWRPKGHHERACWFGETVTGLLREHLAETEAADWVFTSRRGGRLTTAAKLGRTLFARAGLCTPGHVWHELRRACATSKLHEGVDIDTVRRLLGHASVRTTELYLRASEAAARAAASRGLL